MTYVIKIFRLIGFNKLSPSLIGSGLFDASGIEDTLVLALFGIVSFFLTVVTFGGGLFRALGGIVSDLLTDATFTPEDARLGAFGLGVAVVD